MTVETRPVESARLVDPRTRFPRPPQPAREQEGTGTDAQLAPAADHGEQSYEGHGRLAGLVALITGGDSGIGRAVALAYAREGADVVIAYLENDGDAAETRRLVEESGRSARAIRVDVGNERECTDLVEQAIRAFGRLDVLVNNAAHQKRLESLDDLTPDEWRRTMTTNLDAMYYLCRAAVPYMQPGASIINTASVQAYDPSPNLLAYATTKGAIVTFTKALAQMLGPSKGIRVNAVAPGPIWTPLIPSSTPAEGVAKFGGESILGRAGQPVEVAPVYVLLASAEASYITGTVYVVAGGMPLP
jgi:NAD(P)-dependent dehydrogenase (short-subunit alcohol dehydrogenase family)